MGFNFNITKPMHKIWCRLMLQRYLGKFLERNLELDQLSIDLVNGSVRIEDLSLNVNAVNEVLSSINLPLKLVDGFIGSISIDVPWTCLMGEATNMKISNLQLTLNPTDVLKMDDKDAVNSMVESVVNSFVSSSEMARSVIEEARGFSSEKKDDNNQDSLDSFSKVIDAIYSRFCFELENTTIRIEQRSEVNKDMCTAFEVRCERARFMDEQMRACEQEEKSAELITSQPHGLGSITNLNKFLTLDGLGFYTDVFSNISDISEASVLITSMHIRREKMKQLTPGNSPQRSNLNTDMFASTMSDMTAFHSCYQSLTEAHDSSPSHLEVLRPAPAEPELFSNPVKLADVVGQTTVVFRLKNAANAPMVSEADENKIETEIYFKSINMFATPSQIASVKNLLTALSVSHDVDFNENGKPMGKEDYEAIVKTIENPTSGNGANNTLNGLKGKAGNWQQPDEFGEFDSINLDESRGRHSDNGKDGFNSLKNNSIDREEVCFKANIGTFLMYISHRDYLAAEYTKENGGKFNVIEELRTESENFFVKAKKLSISAQINLSELRETCDLLYPKDHLRLVGTSMSVNYVSKRVASSESTIAKLIITNCDASEYLTKESAPSVGKAIRVPIFDYSNIENEENDPNLKIVYTSPSEIKGKSKLELFISACKTEMDFSIVDRITDLIATKPFFDSINEEMKAKEMPQLKDDLFPTSDEEVKPSTNMKIICRNWLVDLRIPIADLRDPAGTSRLPFAQRHVHDEYIRVSLKDVEVTLPKDPEVATVVDLSCSEIFAEFRGKKLDIPNDQKKFLFGTKSGAEKVKIKFGTDARSKRTPCPSRTTILMTEEMTKSMTSPIFMEQRRQEGPFSQTPQTFWTEGNAEDGEIIQAGTRKEMLNFLEECMDFASLKLEFVIPMLRLHIPQQKYLEVLYNRLVNDLVLFQPAAPALRSGDESVNINVHEAFHELPQQKQDSDEDSDTEEDDERVETPRPTVKQEKFNRSVPHAFSTSLNVKKCTILCNTVVKENNIEKGLGQVALELEKANLGATTGYHGDSNHTFFHFTSTKTSIGSSDGVDCRIPKKIESKEFGRWAKSESQVEYISKDDELSNGSLEDSIGVGLHMHMRPDINVKDVLLCIALRNSLFYAKPLSDMGYTWFTQLSQLFTLKDYAIPGYELPQVTTDLHISLNNVVAGYDHCWVNKDSDLKLRAVFGTCNLSSTLLVDSNVWKTVCILENTYLYIANGKCGKESVKFDCLGAEKPKMFVPIFEIGLVHIDLMINAATDPTKKRLSPVYELKCRNDIIQMWLCSDSLSALANMVIEISKSEKIYPRSRSDSGNDEESNADDGKSVAGSVWSEASNGRHIQKMSVGSKLPEEIEQLIQDCIADASAEHDDAVPMGVDAIEEFRTDYRPKADNDFSEFYKREKGPSFSGDDEFCMVDDDIIGSGITNVAGEARVRYVARDEDGEDQAVVIDMNHFEAPDEWRATGLPILPKDHEVPLIRYLVKDVTFRVHLYAGNDLSDKPSPSKSYSTEEYAQGKGKEQIVKPKAKGGPHRDHSAFVVIELTKVTYLNAVFDKDCKALSHTMFNIYDIVVHDCVKASPIKMMMYMYSNEDEPRRTNAPLVSIRLLDNHARDGKMRVSMMPIKINVDQDTLEFLTDFFDETIKNIDFPVETTASKYANNLPTIEVPAEIRNIRLSRKSSKVNSIYPKIEQPPSLNMEPLKPSPIVPKSPLGDLSYLENRKNTFISPVKRPIIDAPLTMSAASIGNMFETPRNQSLPNETDNISPGDDELTVLTNDDDFADDDMTGDWHQNFQTIKMDFDDMATPMRPRRMHDDILSRSTMMGSIHPTTMVDDLIDTNTEDDEDEDYGGNFLDSLEENDSKDEEQGTSSVDDENLDEANTEQAAAPPPPQEEQGFGREQTFFKEFVFSPAINIYIDYHGKSKISMEKDGPLLGVLKAFGQLNKMPITLSEIEYTGGLLGAKRCFSHAISEWANDIDTKNVITSIGPLSSVFQIGKGFVDLFWMPMEEMRRHDGQVVRGIQNGVGSFGMSSAAGLVGMAQTVTGFVQSFAEMALREVRPDGAHLNNRNRRLSRTQNVAPSDIRHSLQLVYGILHDGYQQTKDDLELAAQEDRASGASVVRSAFRYAGPTFFGPIVMATQVTYQLLGGLRNQLRPDAYKDEQRKWGEDNVPGGIGKN